MSGERKRHYREAATEIVYRATGKQHPTTEWPDGDAGSIELFDAAADFIGKVVGEAEDRGTRNGRIAERANILGQIGRAHV